MNAILSAHEYFSAACERMEREARKPVPLVDCPICGNTRVAESTIQPGRCWICEDDPDVD